MKRKTLIILSFLLVLYIVPMILVPSSLAPARQNNPNMTRDFSLSEYGDESPQSITSFSETLADDVLFFPENESHGSGYAESFADISDWTAFTTEASDSFTTDGDLGSMKTNGGAAADSDYYQSNSPNIANTNGNYYIEMRYRCNTTNFNILRIHMYPLDNRAGTQQLFDLSKTTTWTTIKTMITLAALESILLETQGDIGENVNVEYDYVRAAISTEMGWQHDGSTTTGISSADGGTIATDGDIITLTSDIDASSFVFAIDTTATQASLGTAYYPFLTIECTSISVGDGYSIEQYDGAAWAKPSAIHNEWGWITTTGIIRYNMASLDTYVQKFRLNFTQTAIIKFDFLKAYSIANFTYTGSGISVDDYLYVSSDVLYCSGTSFTSIILDHDPALANTYYAGWNMSTSSGTPQIDFYVGAWLGYSSATSGELPLGTLTDTRVKFTASANIISIKFIDLHDWHIIATAILEFETPNWHIIATAIIQFWTAVDTTYLDWLLIFLGLIMIPASTLYLVKGGKDGMSANKFFYFIIAFMLGWGLLLGGIM